MAELVEIQDRIKDVLGQLRPYLEEDGGDLELVEFTDGIAKIELKGNCTSCSMNGMTFKNSIEDAVLRAVPEVKAVEAINFSLVKPSL